MSSDRTAADPSGDDYRRRLREFLRSNPGLLMNVLETVAGAEDKELLRSVVGAAFFVFSGEEESLPGGRDFWTRMKTNISPPQEMLSLQADRKEAWKDVTHLRKEIDRHASSRPDVRAALEELDRRGGMPGPKSNAAGPAPAQAAAPPGPHPAPARGLETELDAVRRKLFSAPPEAAAQPAPPPFAQVILPLPPAPAGGGPEGTRALEEKLAVYEEEARMARADLAKLEKKYRENLELLKEEARDRGSLQKQLGTTQAEVAAAQDRLREEQEKLADARRRLEKRERELETLEERLHATEIELVRKEEEISMAMQHLRDEEAERRRVLDALRQEAREKSQMEHRLKRREEELSRLETRIVEEEKRIAALRGSQAISEEEAIRKAAELRRREEGVKATEAEMRSRLESLRSEEEGIRERVVALKRELRDGEVLDAQLKKREELRAALEERYRRKENELVRELKELERLKAGIDVAERSEPGTAAPAPPPPVPADGSSRASQRATSDIPAPPDSAPETPAQSPARPAPIIKMLVVAPPPGEEPPEAPEPPAGPTTPARLFPDTRPQKDRTREELLDMLARKKKAR